MFNNFSGLTQAGQIGPLSVKNRMIVTAMGVNLAEDGHCGERIIAFHERQAKGGVGLIVLGVAGVMWPRGSNQPGQIAISDDRFIPGLRNMADAVHAQGAKIATQLHHGGLVATEDTRQGRPMWVPSYPVIKKSTFHQSFLDAELMKMNDPDGGKPQLHVMTEEDIDTLVQNFGNAARRAKEAGFDGVEIHGGHGYIISEFLSPSTNQRDDQYGGSLENRARLLVEVIAAVKQAAGNDMAVWCKLDSGEFGNDEGICLEDAKTTARIAQQAGAQAITVSAFHDVSEGILHSESNIPHTPERLVNNAIAIKKGLSIPVITSGRIEVKSANRHINQGHFDYFGMGRKMLADPDLPNKVAANAPEQIRPCVYCYCCVSQIYIRDSVKCAVNAETAFERERSLIASDSNKHVAVIGGGPAGMEAARRLAIRGIKVTLIERADRLGGTLQFASIAYQPNEKLLNWLRLQVKQGNIDVKLNTEATPALLNSLAVDEVVVATGAKRTLPDIPGAQQPFVFSGDEMRALILSEDNPALAAKTNAFTQFMTKMGKLTKVNQWPSVLRIVSKFWLPMPKNIVVIGAELVGLELAEFLVERGRTVTVLDDAKKPGAGLYIVRRMRLLTEIQAHGVTLLNNATDIRIGDHCVSYTNYRGQRRTLAAEQIIVAKGATGDITLADELTKAGFSVHAIGDCTGVSYIEGAIESAAELVQKIA